MVILDCQVDQVIGLLIRGDFWPACARTSRRQNTKASNYLPSLLLVNYLNFLLERHFKKYNFSEATNSS